MQKRLLILLLAAMVTTAACSKQSAKQPENQQSSDQSQQTPTQSANPQSNVSSPPANPEPTPPPATTPTPEPTPPPATATPSSAAPAAAAATVTETTPNKPPAPKALVVPTGTMITVRTTEPLSSKDSHAGDTFSATVADPVSVRGKTVIPAGATARGTVVDAQARGRIHGEARLELALKQISFKGNTYPIDTSLTSREEKGKGKRSAVTGGAGALIGGIAGGGKGMLIGGAAGLAGGAFTGNKQIELPAETMLSFELKKPLTMH
jgi:hypothetical protein